MMSFVSSLIKRKERVIFSVWTNLGAQMHKVRVHCSYFHVHEKLFLENGGCLLLSTADGKVSDSFLQFQEAGGDGLFQ